MILLIARDQHGCAGQARMTREEGPIQAEARAARKAPPNDECQSALATENLLLWQTTRHNRAQFSRSCPICMAGMSSFALYGGSATRIMRALQERRLPASSQFGDRMRRQLVPLWKVIVGAPTPAN